MKKGIMQILCGWVVLYILLCFYIFFTQSDLIFFPSGEMLPMVESRNMNEVYFQTQDGINLNGWYIDNKSDTTILFFHGNGGNISYNQERIELFNDLGVNALLVDYRGYGKSSGNIQSEEDIYNDGTAAYQFLMNRGIKSENVIIWWQSLGWAIACKTAEWKSIRGIILESTFTSLDEKSKEKYWFLPTSILLRYHFRNIDIIENFSSPLLIIHSTDDEVFDYAYWQKLYLAAHEPKRFLTTKGSHNWGFQTSYELYKKEISTFIGRQERTNTWIFLF